MEAPDPAVHYLELVTPDPDAACRLYATAFGWRFEGPVPELGNARVATRPDGSRCGIRAPLHPDEAPCFRPYFRVGHLEAATREAERLGARTLLESMELPGWGVISIHELGGVQQGLWEVR